MFYRKTYKIIRQYFDLFTKYNVIQKLKQNDSITKKGKIHNFVW
jgi:hypothetical protein